MKVKIITTSNLKSWHSLLSVNQVIDVKEETYSDCYQALEKYKDNELFKRNNKFWNCGLIPIKDCLLEENEIDDRNTR